MLVFHNILQRVGNNLELQQILRRMQEDSCSYKSAYRHHAYISYISYI